MGQQQLLLLVFGIVLAGGVVVAGAHAFKGGKPQHNRGIVFQEALSIVADLQAWKGKPHTLRGGANVTGFDRINFRMLDRPHTLLSKRVYKTEYGCYLLQVVGDRHQAEVTISAPSCAHSDFVARVVVRGASPGEVDWLNEPASEFPLLKR